VSREAGPDWTSRQHGIATGVRPPRRTALVGRYDRPVWHPMHASAITPGARRAEFSVYRQRSSLGFARTPLSLALRRARHIALQCVVRHGVYVYRRAGHHANDQERLAPASWLKGGKRPRGRTAGNGRSVTTRNASHLEEHPGPEMSLTRPYEGPHRLSTVDHARPFLSLIIPVYNQRASSPRWRQ